MEDTELKIGDVVVLNSGGPNMTIIDIIQGDTAVCCWIFQDCQCFNHQFNLKCIKKSV